MRTRLYLKDVSEKPFGMDLKTVVFGDHTDTLDMVSAYIIGYAYDHDISIEKIIKTLRNNYKSYVTQMEGEDE